MIIEDDEDFTEYCYYGLLEAHVIGSSILIAIFGVILVFIFSGVL